MNKKVSIIVISVLGVMCLSLAYWVKVSRDRIVALENSMGALNVLAMDAANATPEQIIELYKFSSKKLTIILIPFIYFLLKVFAHYVLIQKS
jgi:hypothetical protein